MPTAEPAEPGECADGEEGGATLWPLAPEFLLEGLVEGTGFGTPSERLVMLLR